MTRYTPMPPDNFGGLPEDHAAYETARAVIFPVPLERTTTFQHGTRGGPAAILAASRNMELYDDEIEIEPYREIGIATLPPIDTMDGTLEEVMTELFTAELALLDDHKFPVAIGGEHSLTPPLVLAMAKKYKNLNVLHIGAHERLRDNYQGNPTSHACAMRRVVENFPAVQVGIRSLSADEAQAIPRLKTRIYWAKNIVRTPLKNWIAKVLEDLAPRTFTSHQLISAASIASIVRQQPGFARTRRTRLAPGYVADPRRRRSQENCWHGRRRTASPARRPCFRQRVLAARLIYKSLGYIFCQK